MIELKIVRAVSWQKGMKKKRVGTCLKHETKLRVDQLR